MPRFSERGRPLRIVHVSPSYAPLVGGAERLLQAVSERLVERGHDVTVLTFDCSTMRDFHSPEGAGLPRRETLNGVQIVRVNPTSSRLQNLSRWWLRQRGGWRTSSWVLGEELWPLGLPNGLGMVLPLSRLAADVVTSVNWCFGMSFWSCLPRALRRSPRVAVPILHIERPWAQNPMYERMLRRCDAVIVCTDAERDFVRARGGRDIAVAGAGVDARRFARRDGASVRARHGIRDRLVVGFVGRQDTTKGVPTLIESMRIVWAQMPDTVLLFAGQSAHREPKVTAMLAALSDEERARVVQIDDFTDEEGPSIMDACDVLALPSAEESFGLVMIEAWACGKPVVGADIASTRCIIEPGVDGWTATPFDAPDLADKLLDLLADPAKRAAFGARGRAKTLSRYTWDRVTDVWESTLKRAAGREMSVTPIPRVARADTPEPTLGRPRTPAAQREA